MYINYISLGTFTPVYISPRGRSRAILNSERAKLDWTNDTGFPVIVSKHENKTIAKMNDEATEQQNEKKKKN